MRSWVICNAIDALVAALVLAIGSAVGYSTLHLFYFFLIASMVYGAIEYLLQTGWQLWNYIDHGSSILCYLVMPGPMHDLNMRGGNEPENERSFLVRVVSGLRWPALALFATFWATGAWWSFLAPVLVLVLQYKIVQDAHPA